MSYLIPTWELSQTDKKHFRQAVIEAMLGRSLALGVVDNRRELVVEDLEATNIGLEKWKVNKHPAGEWFDWVECHQVRENTVIGIFKVAVISPLTPWVQKLKFQLGLTGATTKAVFSLSQLYSMIPLLKAIEKDIVFSKLLKDGAVKRIEDLTMWPIMEGYLSEPIIYNPEDFIMIKLLCDSVTGGNLVLGGLIISKWENKGGTIWHNQI